MKHENKAFEDIDISVVAIWCNITNELAAELFSNSNSEYSDTILAFF